MNLMIKLLLKFPQIKELKDKEVIKKMILITTNLLNVS